MHKGRHSNINFLIMLILFRIKNIQEGLKNGKKEEEKEKAIDMHRGNAKPILIVLTFLFLVSVASAYTIEGKSVIFEDSYAKLEIYPYKTSQPVNDFTQYFELTNKTAAEADLYAAAIFDAPLANTKIWLWHPIVYGWIEENYACGDEFTYELNVGPEPNKHYGECYYTIYDVNGELGGDVNVYLWQGSFRTGNLATGTVYFDVYGRISQGYYSNITSNFSYYNGGAEHYYYSTSSLHFNPYETKKLKINFEPQSISGKWEAVGWTGASWNCILSDTCNRIWRIDPWWDNDFSYKQQLTLDTDQLSGNVINDHVILVHIGADNTDFWTNINTDVNDVRFTNAAEDTAYDYHIEDIDYAGNDANIWVEVTDTFTSDTNLMMYMYYGDADSVDAQDEAGTYNSDYNVVLHMDQLDANALDSTNNNYDLNETNNPSGSITGRIGKGIDYGNNRYASNPTLLDGNNNVVSFSFWFKSDATINSTVNRYAFYKSKNSNNYYAFVLGADTAGEAMGVTKSQATTISLLAGGPWNANTWYHMVFTSDTDNDHYELYSDGVSIDSDDNVLAAMDLGAANPFYIAENGASYFDGVIDELKIFNIALTDDDAKLLYLSESDTLISFGAEQEPDEITADFNYTTPGVLDPENGINSTSVDLNDTSTFLPLIIPNAYVWAVDDINFSSDQNTSYAFTAVGDYNVCLTVFADANTYSNQGCHTITVSQAPQSVDFTWAINAYANSDVNIQFTDISTTDNTDVNYWWFYADTNYFSTDQNANVKFAIYGDLNVCHVVTDNDANKQTCKIFDSTVVTVKIPKDEDTDAQLTPFEFQIYTIPTQNYTNLSSDTNFFIFTFVEDIYSFIVDFNSDYYERAYNVTADGNYYIIQPYLAAVADSISTTVYTKYYSNFTSYPGIRVESYKDIGGEETLIESVVTDAKGEALMSFIVNDVYTIKAYDGDTFVAEETLNATSADLYIYIDIKDVVWGVLTTPLVITKFRPIGGRIYVSTTLTQEITVSEGTPSMIHITVTNQDVNIYDTNWTTGIAGGLTNIILISDLSGIDANYVLEITVYVHLTNGTVFIDKAYYTLPTGIDIWQLLTDVRADFGCSTDTGEPCFFLLMFSFFISLMACGAVAINFAFMNAKGLVILFLAILGLFTLFGWVPVILFGLICFAGIGAVIFMSREG